MPKKKIINESLVNYLVQSNLPMSTVNNDSFKKLIKNLSPDCSLPSRGFLTYNLIPEKVIVLIFLFYQITVNYYVKILIILKYNILKEKLLCDLKTVSMCCITNDIWTSNSQF